MIGRRNGSKPKLAVEEQVRGNTNPRLQHERRQRPQYADAACQPAQLQQATILALETRFVVLRDRAKGEEIRIFHGDPGLPSDLR